MLFIYLSICLRYSFLYFPFFVLFIYSSVYLRHHPCMYSLFSFLLYVIYLFFFIFYLPPLSFFILSPAFSSLSVPLLLYLMYPCFYQSLPFRIFYLPPLLVFILFLVFSFLSVSLLPSLPLYLSVNHSVIYLHRDLTDKCEQSAF